MILHSSMRMYITSSHVLFFTVVTIISFGANRISLLSLLQTIKNIIEPQLPRNVVLKKQNILAIKLKVNRLLPKLRDDMDYKSFLSVNNMSISEASSLNADNMDCTEDEVCKVHVSTWRELMSNNNGSDSDVFSTLKEYMEMLKMKDKDFIYDILYDTYGEITGCLWMTSTMRMNFELYGGYLSVDAMKRDLNTLLWPYMATSMWNELNQVCVGCEGILLSEREEAYKALLEFQVSVWYFDIYIYPDVCE